MSEKDSEEFPICHDCGQRHEVVPDKLILNLEDLGIIQQKLADILAFSQQKHIPLMMISGMIQTFHTEIMDELQARKRQMMHQLTDLAVLSDENLKEIISNLQENLNGSGLQEEVRGTESKASSGKSSSSGADSSSGDKEIGHPSPGSKTNFH